MSALVNIEVVKRNGTTVPFDVERIKRALLRAYSAASIDPESGSYDEIIESVLAEITIQSRDRAPRVEEIQDLVEKKLVHFDQYEVSKRYILYRETHRQKRELDTQTRKWRAESGAMNVVKRDGTSETFNPEKILRTIKRHATGHAQDVDCNQIMDELPKNIFDGIDTVELQRALILSVVAFIEQDSAYNYLAAHLLLDIIYRESGQKKIQESNFQDHYRDTFIRSLTEGVEDGIFTKDLLTFDLEQLANTLIPERDHAFNYLGIHTLYERYFVKSEKRVVETPQAFWMRVAMGLAIKEKKKD